MPASDLHRQVQVFMLTYTAHVYTHVYTTHRKGKKEGTKERKEGGEYIK